MMRRFKNLNQRRKNKMATVKEQSKFNVIIYDINHHKFKPYDVMPYLRDRYQEARAKDKPVTTEQFQEFVKSNAMYQWWSRCEYEIILRCWPNLNVEEKWDVYQQVMMNIELITELLMKDLGTTGKLVETGKKKTVKKEKTVTAAEDQTTAIAETKEDQ